jgi:hypothetical protein
MVPIVATGVVAFGTMSVMAASPRLPPPGQSQAGRETAATPTLPSGRLHALRSLRDRSNDNPAVCSWRFAAPGGLAYI